MNKQEQLLRDAYEWWHYLISTKENDRLMKKYYPDEPCGYPRFFMDTDKLRMYMLENGIEQGGISTNPVEPTSTAIDTHSILRLRNYFGEHDKTPFEHWAFRFLGGIIKNLDAVEAMPESKHDSTCIRCNKSGIQSEWHKVGAERGSGYGGDPICDECYSNLMDEDLAVEAMGVQQEKKFTTILLPKEIKSVQELREQITAHPDLWNVLSVYEAAKTLANNEAANTLLKLTDNEIRTLSLYYSIKP